MTTRRRNLILLVAILAGAVAVAYFATPPATQRQAADAIPADAFLVITLDLPALRESPLAKEVGAFHEVDEVTRRCGFDPLARAQTVAVGVPEKPDGVFGLSITSDLSRDELAHCADRVMGARGASPRITQKDGWSLLEQDPLAEALAGRAGGGKIAYRDGAPLLIARGDYLANMQAALDGKTPRARTDPEHAALRAAALAHSTSPLLVASAVLPKSLRDRLKKELEQEAVGAAREGTMNAVLSVKSVAFAVSARPHSGDLDVFAELRCESEGDCMTVRDFVDKKRKAFASQPGARFIGLGALLDALVLETHGSALDVTLTAPESEIARAIRGLFEYAAPPPPILDAGPDETLRAPKR